MSAEVCALVGACCWDGREDGPACWDVGACGCKVVTHLPSIHSDAEVVTPPAGGSASCMTLDFMRWDGEYWQPTWATRLKCRLIGHTPHPLWSDLCGRCAHVGPDVVSSPGQVAPR